MSDEALHGSDVLATAKVLAEGDRHGRGRRPGHRGQRGLRRPRWCGPGDDRRAARSAAAHPAAQGHRRGHRRSRASARPTTASRSSRRRLPAVVCVDREDQRAALPVLQGDHGREEEAGLHADRGGPRHRRVRGRSGRRVVEVLEASPKPPRSAGQRVEDEGDGGSQDRRVPGRPEAHLKARRNHMAEVLVLVDHVDGEIKKVTYELLTAARALGEPSAVVVGAAGTAAKLPGVAGRYGAAKIYVVETDDASLPGHPEGRRAGRARGTDVAGRGADRRHGRRQGDRGPARRPPRLRPARRRRRTSTRTAPATQSIFGGAFVVEAKVATGIPVITVRPGAVEAEAAAGRRAEETVECPAVDAAKSATVTGREPIVGGDRPELTEASVVVSGGRGVGSAEKLRRRRGAGRLAGCGRRRLARRRRLRLLPAPVPGRADRQDGVAAALHRAGHLGCDPAPRRHADLEDDRRGQQGRRGARSSRSPTSAWWATCSTSRRS